MIPSTTGLQATTAPTAAAVPAASHYGSVALHSGPNLLQGRECPLPLQHRPVLQRSFEALATDSSLQKLPAGDQSRLMKTICQIQNETAHLVYEEATSLWNEKSLLEDKVKKLTSKNKLLNSEVAARQKENEKLKKANERAKCQLEESQKKEITAKVDIQKLQQELRDQKKSLEENFESIAKFKTDIASAIGCSVASATKYQEAISFEDLIKEVSALKRKLDSFEVESSSLKKTEKALRLRQEELTKDAAETLLAFHNQ